MLKIKAALATFAVAMLWANSAFAFCIGPWCFGGDGGGGGGPAPAPEIDGPASLTAVALLISVGAIVYRKMKD
ncbi:hypothetical protein [Hyphomicrobium sp. MC8b]|uniref:hypothetical protein n=1 Tax=Hyphomicrobium sp. MC8b TaxID=300273 RepID=UPI00391A14B1